MDELFIDRLSEFPFHAVTLHILEKMLSQGSRFQFCSSFKMRHQQFLIFAVLKKNLRCQKWRNLSLHWLRRKFSSLLLGVEVDDGNEELGEGRVAKCMSTMASVLQHLALAWSGGGRSGNVLICDEPRPDCVLVPALSNLVLKLCGATTQTALLSPAVVLSFKGETRCVLVYAIKTEATSHSEENSTLCQCSHKRAQ